MATETKKVEAAEPKVAPPSLLPQAKDVVEEKAVADDAKAIVAAQKTEDPSEKKSSKGGSIDRDIALAKVENEKRLSFIKAWEESEKSKVENKAEKKLSEVAAWENSKKAALEARLKKMEEELEKKKAEYAEKMKNKVALVVKEADEKRATVVAKRQEDILKADEMAAKYRATNQVPQNACGCLG